MLKRTTLTLALGLTCLTGALAVEVPLTVTNRAKVARRELAAGGVPLPMGHARDTAGFRVFDAAGKAVPAQFTVLNRWPADKSIRWVLVQFPAELRAGATGRFVLKTAAKTPAPKPGHVLKISDEKERVVVDTGVLRFSVRKKGFALFDTVEILGAGGKAQPLAGKAACGPGVGVETGKGRKFTMGADDGSRVTIEDAGPLRATVRAEGRHKDGKGGSLLDYQVRIYAYAGSRAVRVQYVFTRSGGKWPKELTDFKRVALRIKPALKGPLTRTALEPSGKREPTGVNQVLRLATAPISAEKPAKRHYEGPAVVSVSDARGTGLAATVRWFWQLRPKSMEVARDGAVTVNIIDARTEAEAVHFYPGMSKTHDMLFQFAGPGGPAGEASAAQAFQQPLFVKCPPEWYCQKTLSLGRLVSADYKGYLPQVKGFAKLVDQSFTRQIKTIRELRSKWADRKRGVDSYTVIHFGDGFHHLKSSGHRSVEWDNCYYSYTHMLAMQYARTGSDLILDTLREAVSFEGDIAVVWHQSNLGAPRVNPGAYHIGGFSGWKRFSSGTWNFYKPVGMIELFYLTGDRRHQEAGLANARWMLSHNGYGMLHNPRSCGAGLRAAVHGYLATGDEGFLHVARKTGLYAIGMQKTFGHFAPIRNSIFMCPNALEGLCVYQEFTGDPVLGKVLPGMVKAHARKFSSPASTTYGFMNLYVAALAGDEAYKKEVLGALAGRGRGLGVRRGNHAIKDFSSSNRGVPLMMWYLSDLAGKPTPWAGKVDLGPYPRSRADCPRMAAPKLDGKVGKGEWEAAAELKLVYDPNPKRKLVAPTTLRIGHDMKNLYLLILAEEPKMGEVRTNIKEEGGPVYQDDCVEIYASPVPRRYGLKFIVNAAGVRATRARGYEKKSYKSPAPGELPVKAGRWEKGWLLEVVLPLDKLGLKKAPAAGAELGFNVARFRNPAPYEGSTWIGGVNQISSTGTVVLK